MNAFLKLPPAWRYAIVGAAAVGVVLLIGFAWIVLGPGPTAFAGGDRVALAGYHGGDPTGVPAELRSASLVARGQYLARARRLRSLPYGQGWRTVRRRVFLRAPVRHALFLEHHA